MKIMEKNKNEEKLSITNIMRKYGHKIFNRILKIDSILIGTGNVEYIMAQKDHKCRYQKCEFRLSTPPPPL